MLGWVGLAASQDGVIARRQLLAAGLTPAGARTQLDAGRWRQLRPGIYLTHTGPADDRVRIWAALLYCGDGAVAGAATALWLAGAVDEPPETVHVVVPTTRRVAPQHGLRVHRSTRLDVEAHPSVLPPRLRLEAAVLDAADHATSMLPVLDLVLRVTQRRLTTSQRLREALRCRTRQRWRALLEEVLADVDTGVESPLERRYLHDVERAHCLPRGERNVREQPGDAGPRYHDVRYRPWSLLVELDGREAHPDDLAFRDLRRDNDAVVLGDTVLRYGWRDVAGSPCEVAAQVAHVLRLRGWAGTVRGCSPRCTAARFS